MRMQAISTGSTAERYVRSFLMVVMFLGAPIWFYYDGSTVYPRKNVTTFMKTKFGMDAPDPFPTIHKRLTRKFAQQYIADFEPGVDVGKVKTDLGEPFVNPDDAGELYFFGPGGRMSIKARRGEVHEAPIWTDAEENPEFDLYSQKLLAFVLLPVGLYALFFFAKVVTSSARLDERGLKINGQPQVAFDEMKAFHSGEFVKRGYIDLEYEKDGGVDSVRLDEYKHKAFPLIVQAICERTDLANPIPPHEWNKYTAKFAGVEPIGRAAHQDDQESGVEIDASRYNHDAPADDFRDGDADSGGEDD